VAAELQSAAIWEAMAMNKSDLVLEVARAAGLTRAIVNPQAAPEKVHA
jgi:hypothetical protein